MPGLGSLVKPFKMDYNIRVEVLIYQRVYNCIFFDSHQHIVGFLDVPKICFQS
jgi:hypothetical protein